MKYMPFNLLLQHFALKMPPFVLNVFSLQTIKPHYPVVEKCVSLQPSDEVNVLGPVLVVTPASNARSWYS